jgi:pimeloyl-ACP methyl ester carboxylesterase
MLARYWLPPTLLLISAMLHSLLVSCLAFALSSDLFAQIAGYRNLTLPNPTSQGSSSLPVRIYYPATTAGQNAPIVTPPASGYPVVVFLHGLFQIGRAYSRLGNHLAKNGYVAVMNETGQFSPSLQADDGAALYHALVVANGQSGNVFQGALDMSRAGLCGHSVGGGNTLTVLASNPGYKAGLCYAPIYPGASTASQVEVPLAIIQGTGDLVLIWSLTGLPMFNDTTNFTGLKTFYLFGFSGGHNSVPGLYVVTSGDSAVWQRSRRVTTGFFDRFLMDEAAGLEEVIGAAALAEPLLSQIYVEVEEPDVWLTGQPAIGQTVQIQTSSEPGVVLYGAAAGTAGPIPTPFGDLLLDPASMFVPYTATVAASRFATVSLDIPNDVQLIGTQVAFQSLGLSNGGGYRLTSTATLVVTN